VTAPEREPPHETATLLPWYVAGTLGAGEAAAVEAHLRGCEGCRAEEAELRRLRTAVHAAVETRPSPSPDLLARIAARVEAAAPRRAPEPAASWWSRLVEWAGSLLSPRLAPAMALGLIVLQFGAIAVLGARLYETAYGPAATTQGGPPPAGAPVAGETRLRVAFDEAATARRIRAVLQEAGARVVDGPSAAGFYTVAGPAGAADALRRHPDVVRFVEPLEPR